MLNFQISNLLASLACCKWAIKEVEREICYHWQGRKIRGTCTSKSMADQIGSVGRQTLPLRKVHDVAFARLSCMGICERGCVDKIPAPARSLARERLPTKLMRQQRNAKGQNRTPLAKSRCSQGVRLFPEATLAKPSQPKGIGDWASAQRALAPLLAKNPQPSSSLVKRALYPLFRRLVNMKVVAVLPLGKS